MATRTVFAKFVQISVQVWRGEYHFSNRSLASAKIAKDLASLANLFKLGCVMYETDIFMYEMIYSTFAILAKLVKLTNLACW